MSPLGARATWFGGPDCGSSYRQHFAVTDLCAAIYAREDQGGCCARRKSGKMKLSFTKYFPAAQRAYFDPFRATREGETGRKRASEAGSEDEVSLATGLPNSAPNANSVGPCSVLPSAMAGDSAALLQEKSHQAEEKARKGLPLDLSKCLFRWPSGSDGAFSDLESLLEAS